MTLDRPKDCCESHFHTKKIDFPKIMYKNVQFAASTEAKNLELLVWPVPNFYSCPLLSFFLTHLLSLPFAFHILSG